MTPVKYKVFAYITHGNRLLVFRHTDFPEAGIQVPAGTVMSGEELESAVLREAREETGLEEAKKSQVPPPEGFRYQADILSVQEEQTLVEHISKLPLKEFEFHGYVGKRRTMSFGWHYDFGHSKLKQTEAMPAFLLSVRERSASFAGLSAEDLPHALVTEYGPGAAIGWHRDKGVFGEVVGVSLLSPCNFRFRRKAGSTWERYSLITKPRSVYLLRGESRTLWEHSIPGVDSLRYSITFRSLRGTMR